MRILIVEDDPALCFSLQRTLEEAGFAVDCAYDGDKGASLGASGNYDAVVLDLGLPKQDGLGVLRGWREDKVQTPVLILTARSRWSEKSAGFNAGADDYLTKPFEPEEVVVRLRALIRRSSGHSSPEITCGPVSLDTSSGRVCVSGKTVDLTAQEHRILSYLMHHQKTVVPKDRLERHVYDGLSETSSNVLDVLVGRIRRKLGVAVLATLRGRGYRMEPPPDAPADGG